MMDNKLESGSRILYVTKKKLVFTINIILKKPLITYTFLIIEKNNDSDWRLLGSAFEDFSLGSCSPVRLDSSTDRPKGGDWKYENKNEKV